MRYSSVRSARAGVPRARDNEALLLDAAVEALAEAGWSGCLPSPVGERAGLSRQPALQRFPNQEALACAVWEARVNAALDAAITRLLDAAAMSASRGRRAHLTAAVREFLVPTVDLRAGVELLIVSQFQPRLRAAVARTLGQSVTRACNPRSHGKQGAALRASLIAQALGLLVLSGRPGIKRFDVAVAAGRLDWVISHPGAPRTLPSVGAAHLYDADIPFHTGDAISDRLLNAALHQVGTYGFDGVSVKAIAHEAGYSEGAIWNRWPSKAALFHEATMLQSRVGMSRNEQWLDGLAARYGEAIAEAVTIREQMKPGREVIRAVYLEQMRVVRRDPVLSADVEREIAAVISASRLAHAGRDVAEHKTIVHCAWSMSYGLAMLATLAPATWQLPFVCITEPLTRGPR